MSNCIPCPPCEGDEPLVCEPYGTVTTGNRVNPAQFEEIIFADHYASWGTNNVIVLRNGSLIEGVTQDLILNTTWPNQITLRFEGSTWRVYSIL